MKFDGNTKPYIEGKKFSNSLKVYCDFHGVVPDRVEFVVNLTRGKRVVHLGCLDHLPLIEDKVNRRKWLHKELTESCSACIGIDIDKEAYDFVQTRYGFDNIFLSDFTKDNIPQVSTKKWDYAVLGELLEHIDNPVEFLSSIKKNYSGTIDKIIITVPNAWTRTTMRMAAKSVEIINSDHRYWFTPYTLAKVMHHAGIESDETFFTNRVPLNRMELVSHKLLSLIGQTPGYNFTYASSIVAVGRL